MPFFNGSIEFDSIDICQWPFLHNILSMTLLSIRTLLDCQDFYPFELYAISNISVFDKKKDYRKVIERIETDWKYQYSRKLDCVCMWVFERVNWSIRYRNRSYLENSGLLIKYNMKTNFNILEYLQTHNNEHTHSTHFCWTQAIEHKILNRFFLVRFLLWNMIWRFRLLIHVIR